MSLPTCRSRSDEGFTLIELLVVTIVIAVLAAIAIPLYLAGQNNAKDAAVVSDVSNAKTAVIAHQSANNGKLVTSLTIGASTSTLQAVDGYTPPTASNTNYGTIPAITVGSQGAFCIAAISVTGRHIAESDLTGVATGICSTSGLFVATSS